MADLGIPLVEVLGTNPMSANNLRKYWGTNQTTDAVLDAWKVLENRGKEPAFLRSNPALCINCGDVSVRFDELSFDAMPVAGILMRDGVLLKERSEVLDNIANISQYLALISFDDEDHVVGFPSHDISEENVWCVSLHEECTRPIAGVNVVITAVRDDDGDDEMTEASLFGDEHYVGLQGSLLQFRCENPLGASQVQNMCYAGRPQFYKSQGHEIQQFRCVGHFGFKNTRIVPPEEDPLDAYYDESRINSSGTLTPATAEKPTTREEIVHFLYGLHENDLICVVTWTEFGSKSDVQMALQQIFRILESQPKSMVLLEVMEWWLNATMEPIISKLYPLTFQGSECSHVSMNAVGTHPCFILQGKHATSKVGVYISKSRETSGVPLSEIFEHKDDVFEPESKLFTISPMQMTGTVGQHPLTAQVDGGIDLFKPVHRRALADFVSTCTRNFILMDVPFFEIVHDVKCWIPTVQPLAMILDNDDDDEEDHTVVSS